MDTRLTPQEMETALGDIKRNMPEVYASIQAKSAEIGPRAFALVRRGLNGQPNCFYAFERGRVVGTPFKLPEIAADVATTMVRFGLKSVSIFQHVSQEVASGPH